MNRTEFIQNAHLIIIKVGSSLLVRDFQLDVDRLQKLAGQISALLQLQKKIILVSSGAMACGMSMMGFHQKRKDIPFKQAMASIGQGVLMQYYCQAFLRFQRPVAQILLAPEDISNRHKYLNARNTLETLLDLGVVPIVNENDTVAIEELKFGDNDRLSALVASLVDAQLLIILSDVDGLFSADPKKDPTATLIPEVPRVSSDIESMAGGEGTTVSTGGMKSKVLAARIASISGAGVILASGKDFGILHRIMHGETVGTFFYPQPETLKNRKRWIAFGMMIHGKIFIDFGAAEALLQNKSLLPAGIRKVTGTFDVGDCVEIMDETGCLMGRGMVNYSSTELKKIHGLHSTELRVIFPDRIFEEEVIHIDNMVLFHREEKENV